MGFSDDGHAMLAGSIDSTSLNALNFLLIVVSDPKGWFVYPAFFWVSVQHLLR
jgi:hypothetical protein